MELLYNQGFGGMTRPKEWITPHKVSLLILILEYAEKEKTGDEGWDLRVSRKFSRALLTWIQVHDYLWKCVNCSYQKLHFVHLCVYVYGRKTKQNVN